jgi:DNA-binding CsgD family transcriptional regulator
MLSHAYIIYRVVAKSLKPKVFFNEEVKSIIFPTVPEREKASLPGISTLCSRWKELLDQKQDEIRGSFDKGGQRIDYIDILQSWRRRYTVRGILLSERMPISKEKEKSYLFIIDRLKPENLDLIEIFRQWNLNHREQEIVRLIISDHCNKEIAKHLGISLNTIKGYMKLLMRKVGVHTRAGVISTLLTKKKVETPHYNNIS